MIQTIKRIYNAFKRGKGISWGELAILQDNHALIKKNFPDDCDLWQLAGIDEQEWNTRGNDD